MAKASRTSTALSGLEEILAASFETVISVMASCRSLRTPHSYGTDVTSANAGYRALRLGQPGPDSGL